jgi:hypothetical protein
MIGNGYCPLIPMVGLSLIPSKLTNCTLGHSFLVFHLLWTCEGQLWRTFERNPNRDVAWALVFTGKMFMGISRKECWQMRMFSTTFRTLSFQMSRRPGREESRRPYLHIQLTKQSSESIRIALRVHSSGTRFWAFYESVTYSLYRDSNLHIPRLPRLPISG